MKVVDRQEFARIFNHKQHGLGDSDSPLWALEKYKNSWFVCLDRPLNTTQEYFTWCRENLNSMPLCYSSGDKEEWWGFGDYEDIFLWTMRWR